nr:hypothetical protein [Candidatus Sigynarchaeota archaeon]
MEHLTDEQKKNAYLIKREFIRELDKGLGKIKKLISKTYSSLLINVPSNVFYSLYFRGGVRNHVLNQIKISLRMAIEYDGNNLNAIVDKYKDEYLSHDLISLNCRREHRSFKELQEITVNNLYSRIPILHALINSRGGDYNDLVKNAFHAEEEVRRVLEIQLIFIDQWIDLIAEDKSILMSPKLFGVGLPIDTDVIFKIILETYEYGIDRLEKKMAWFFPDKLHEERA